MREYMVMLQHLCNKGVDFLLMGAHHVVVLRVEVKSRMDTQRGSTAFLSSPQLSLRWNRQENKH